MIDETTKYAKLVVDGTTPACRYVRLACQRHLNDLKRKDVWFDYKAATRFFRWCGELKHYKGPARGTHILLEPWQKFFFGCVYGWKRVVAGKRTDFWRFNICYLEVPRKNGKTTVSAAAASYDCALMEETGAEIYCLATKEEQAKLLYNDVAAYIGQNEELEEVFEILQGKNMIFATASKRTSFIRPLGADSKRQDGLNPFGAFCDELHAWPKRELWDVMADAFGARENWHMIAITTAGHDRQGICYQQRTHLVDILEGTVTADNKFGVIYTVDDDQKDNWRDEKNWYIANPNLGTGKLLEYMKNKCEEAEQLPSSLNPFLNKQLNIWTDVAEAWLRVDDWNACRRRYTEDDLARMHCYGGLDLARVNDLSAVAYLFRNQMNLPIPHVLVDFYMPKDTLRQHSERDGVSYETWVQQGLITATPGNTTDFNYIRADVLKRAKQFIIDEMAFDRHFAGELVNNLAQDGIKLVEIGMGFVSMTPPTAELERLIISKDIAHPNHPVLNWCAGNVVIRRDPAGGMKPDKELSQRRIDGIVALIMALARLMEGQGGPSVYEKRGPLIL